MMLQSSKNTLRDIMADWDVDEAAALKIRQADQEQRDTPRTEEELVQAQAMIDQGRYLS